MDYKQKYEEDLERARTFSQRWQGIEATDSELALQELKKIFPELKESEDEIIRKECISIIDAWDKSCRLQGDYCEVAPKCIAWLEKQGEQKTVEFDDTNVKRMFIKALERVEEQNNKGYKLTDCDKNSWWEDFKAYSGYTEMQKHAWSEEDEEIKEAFVKRILENYNGCSYINGISEDVVIDWLKSLKERMKGE